MSIELDSTTNTPTLATQDFVIGDNDQVSRRKSERIDHGRGSGPVDATYRIYNQSSDRALQVDVRAPFAVTTVSRSSNTGDNWKVTRIGELFRIRQRKTGRFLEVHGDLVLTTATASDAHGLWAANATGAEQSGRIMISHLGSGGVLDADVGGFHSAHTRGSQENSTNDWVWRAARLGAFELQHQRSGRVLDAEETGSFRVAIRPSHQDQTQAWDFEHVGSVVSITTIGRSHLDAHETGTHGVVTRDPQNNSSQQWALIAQGNGEHTIQQVRTGRYLEEQPSPTFPRRVRTGATATTDRQRWTFEKIT